MTVSCCMLHVNQVVGLGGSAPPVALVHAPLSALPAAFPQYRFHQVGTHNWPNPWQHCLSYGQFAACILLFACGYIATMPAPADHSMLAAACTELQLGMTSDCITLLSQIINSQLFMGATIHVLKAVQLRRFGHVDPICRLKLP